MGSQAQGQQPSQVYYDPEMGQYYTQAPQNQFAFSGSPNGSPLNGGLNIIQSMFGRGGERTYLNNFGQSSPALQQAAPYEYANTSLESLFPMLQGAMQGSQGGAMEGGAGLLGSQGATGQASSGAGRFM
jgi:hypothetical protein